jgi:hypothetical protein
MMQTTRQHIAALTDRSPIKAYTSLIGREDLERIIAELTDALAPCGGTVARNEAKRLASCYPTFRPTPEWLKEVEDALKAAPCDLIQRACQTVSETLTFPPNKAQVKEAVERVIDTRRAVRSRAEAMVQEHDRRASAQMSEAQRATAHEAFRKKLAGRSPLEFLRDEGKDTE